MTAESQVDLEPRHVTPPVRSSADGGEQSPESTPFAVEWEEFAPRNETERFRIYCRSNEGELTLIATAGTPEAVGVAIVTLGREGEFDDCACGILDSLGEKGSKWVLRPWEKSPANVSAAGKVLRSARK